MIKPSEDSLVDAGVDYITATYVGPDRDSGLKAFGRYLVQLQTEAGEKRCNFRFSGYHGEHCGSSSWGIRHDGVVVRASSAVAKEHWSQIYSLATNVTRIDVQVTVKPPRGPTRRLQVHHRQLREKRRGVGRPARFKFWYGPDGPEAAALGSRSSDVFLRIYDKGLESGLPEFAGTLRYESELKRVLATRAADSLERTENQQAWIAEHILEIAKRRGLRFAPAGWALPGTESQIQSQALHNENGTLLSPDVELLLGQGRARRTYMWLSVAVRPSVQRFLESGNSDALMEALGIAVQDNALVHRPSKTWTSFDKWRK